MRKIKIFFLQILKHLGLFRLALFCTRRKLRIFCYHGLSYDDEYLFMPGLFIRPETLRKRMMLLKKYGFNVLTLDEATSRLDKISSPSAVLTFDDGFISTFELALPILKDFGFTATIYLTTYYQQKQTPIFRLAMQYIFWKKHLQQLDLTSTKFSRLWDIINDGEAHDEPYRQRILTEAFSVAKLKLHSSLEKKFMRLEEDHRIQQAAQNGFNIELHTHRHRFLNDIADCEQELQDNKKVFKHLFPQQKSFHFCYPSGLWQHQHQELLQKHQIKSATTCDPGLVSAHSNLLLLPRFLDSDIKTDIEFAADLCGITHYMLKIKHLLGINTLTANPD